MQPLRNLHRAILSGRADPAIDDIRSHPRLSPEALLNIYINGYRERLSLAVLADYPCLRRYLGEAEVTKMARLYIEETPSQSYNLDFYPFNFRHYVRAQQSDPAAADIAELEAAIAETFMAPASPPLGVEALQTCDADGLGAMRFALRTEARLLAASCDVEAYWRDSKEDTPQLAAPPSGPSWLLVYRPRYDVLRCPLEPEEFTLLAGLQSGKNLDEAISQTMTQHGLDDAALTQSLAVWLPRWLGGGYFRQ